MDICVSKALTNGRFHFRVDLRLRLTGEANAGGFMYAQPLQAI